MRPVPLREVSGLVSAHPHGVDLSATLRADVEVDSRQVVPGGLFVALPGERADGHDHAGDAVDRGAVAVLSARALPGLPCLVVPDPLNALQALARALFALPPALPVHGITGSSGKTSTKDLLAQVLGGDPEVLAPRESFNNEVGLPLTLLRRRVETRAAVLEYSARGPGHIAFLCGLAGPDVAVVLNVGSAHLGEFGSREGIAAAKGELVEAARQLVVLNADDPLVLGMADRRARGVAVRTFGESGTADVTAREVRVDAEGRPSFLLAERGAAGGEAVSLGLHGRHHVGNALAVAAASLGSGGLTLADVAGRLSTARAVSHWRMEVSQRADGVTVVNDAYNANPESVRAALEALAAMGGGRRRTVAVLGEMAELGPAAPEAHREIGGVAAALGIDVVVAVGPGAAAVHDGAAEAGVPGAVRLDGRDDAASWAARELRPGDVVLVKASRSCGFERLALALASAAVEPAQEVAR